MKNVTPYFPTALSKNYDPTKPPLFENLAGGSTSIPSRIGGITLCHWTCSIKKDNLKNFTVFTRNQFFLNLFFNKFAGCNFIKKRIRQRCLPVNITKILTPTLKKILRTAASIIWIIAVW